MEKVQVDREGNFINVLEKLYIYIDIDMRDRERERHTHTHTPFK
jgi:hypothetical protein